MRGTTKESSEAALQERQLAGQLELGESDELRDRLLGELHCAAQDLETALARKPNAEQRRALQPLLEAVRLSEYHVLELWDSLHRSAVRR